MGQRVYLKEYDFNLTAGGFAVILAEGAYFRVQSSTGALSIIIDGLGELPGLLAGQGIKDTPFKRLTLRDVSGAANVGKLLVSNEEFIDNRTYGVNSLDAATIALMRTPLAYTQSTNVATVLAVATPEVILLPANNVNGVIVQNASYFLVGGLVVYSGGVLAKNAAPANVNDGALIAPFLARSISAANLLYAVDMNQPVFVPAGLGLYWMFSIATNAGEQRATRIRVL